MTTKTTITSSDVARLAQVSQSAVSRTFTPGASVSAKTREKVLAAASELGYRPNALARAVISGRSRLIAVVMAYLDNQFYPNVLEKLSRRLQDKGYQALLLMTEPGNQDEVIAQLLQFQVEGVILASVALSSRLAEECNASGIPIVALNRYSANAPMSSITSDNIEGGRLAARHLVSLGRTRIAYIAGTEDASTNRDREAGFYRGLAECGISAYGRQVGGYSFEGAAAATRRLFANGNGPDGVFVANDHMSFAALDVMRDELGLRVPDDVAVIGYDDVPEARWKGYDLTTISQSSDTMADKAISILFDQINNRQVRNHAVILPARLIVRGTAPAPKD